MDRSFNYRMEALFMRSKKKNSGEQGLALNESIRVPDSMQRDDKQVSRRLFFKKAVIGTAALTTVAGLAKTVVDSVKKPDQQHLYTKSGLAGEDELLNRKYVLMSEQEKADMVESFIGNYPDQT